MIDSEGEFMLQHVTKMCGNCFAVYSETKTVFQILFFYVLTFSLCAYK